MRDSQWDSVRQPRLPSLCLEYGADEENCDANLEISERGMCFHSHWQFSSGTQIGVSVCYNDGHGEPQRARLEGIVVDCQPAPLSKCHPAALRCYQVTVLFMDVPDALLGTIRDVSSLLCSTQQPLAAAQSQPTCQPLRRQQA